MKLSSKHGSFSYFHPNNSWKSSHPRLDEITSIYSKLKPNRQTESEITQKWNGIKEAQNRVSQLYQNCLSLPLCLTFACLALQFPLKVIESNEEGEPETIPHNRCQSVVNRSLKCQEPTFHQFSNAFVFLFAHSAWLCWMCTWRIRMVQGQIFWSNFMRTWL